MTDKIMIADLTPGVHFEDFICYRKSAAIKIDKYGKKYLTLYLSDASGQKTAVKWKATPDEIADVSASKFLRVSGKAKSEKEFSELELDALKLADTPENLKDFLAPFPQNHKESYQRFSVLVKSVNEPNLNRLLKVIFAKSESTWFTFRAATAAQYRHHAYPGGLLEHSVEVAELCNNCCKVIPNLRRDFLVTAALLHDIGKLEEMQQGLDAGEFTESGTLVGHIVSGALLVGNAADKIANFPKNLKSGLMHMLLSHHGRPDFGAAQTPVCSEAWVLHECDNMSAKAHEFQQSMASDLIPGQFSVKKGQGEYHFVGDLGLQEAGTEATTSSTKEFITERRTPDEAISSFETTRMRVRGLVAAGSPDQGSMGEEETREVVSPACGADFLVRVTGDSMADEGIRGRDLLFVKEIETPKDGDIVVAHTGEAGEVVKRYRCEPALRADQEKKWLESENSSQNYPDILIDNNTRIRGKVVGLIRDF